MLLFPERIVDFKIPQSICRTMMDALSYIKSLKGLGKLFLVNLRTTTSNGQATTNSLLRHPSIVFTTQGQRSILRNNLNRHHLLTASLRNLPPRHSGYPRQLASESSQAERFLPPRMQLVKPGSGLVLFPLGSSPESAANQNDAPEPHPCPLSPAYPWASADNPPRPSPHRALVAVVPMAAAAGH
jgi:hypothetical protein